MSDKRADRRTGGLFPDLERKPGQRFARPRVNRPWTPAQEAVAVAAVCACQSKSVFEMMAPFLMDALGHQPVYPENSNVSPRKHMDTCIRALELRIVSKMLAGWKWLPPTIMGFPAKFRDQNAPLTWGERAKIIRPWWRRTGKERIDIGPLHQILGRFGGINSLHPYVSGYLHELDMFETKVKDPEVIPAPIPVNTGNVDELRLMIVNLDLFMSGPVTLDMRNRDKDIIMKSNICKLLEVIT